MSVRITSTRDSEDALIRAAMREDRRTRIMLGVLGLFAVAVAVAATLHFVVEMAATIP